MSKRDPCLYLEDIIESAEAIVDFVDGLSYDDYIKDRKTRSATVREFEVIGEAVKEVLPGEAS